MRECRRCKRVLSHESFSRSKRPKDGGYQAYCKECASAYYRANAAKIKAQVRVTKKRRENEIRALLLAYKLEHPCVDCGETDPDVLDFDHVRGTKLFGIAQFIRLRPPTSRIQAEIKKCEIRCSNCHRKVTVQRRQGSLA